MKRLLRIFGLVWLLAVMLPFLPGEDSARAANEPPYRFLTEWAKLSAVDGRQLQPPVDKNTSMAVLWLLPSAGYHTYAHEAGDEGIPLTVTVLADGEPLPESKVQVHYTAGTEVSLTGGGKSRQLFETAPVFLVFRESEPRAVTLDISLLACSDQHCQPVHTRILLPTAPPELPNAAAQTWFNTFLASKACCGENSVPPEVPPVAETPEDETGTLRHASLLPSAPTSVFKRQSESAVAPAVPVPSSVPASRGYDFTPQNLEGSFQIDGWFRAVGLGLLAGLILNFMPCVLPVLTMKFSMLLDAEEDFEKRRRSIREHTLFFAAGIVTWFAILAVISGVTGMLWGQLFQSSEVIFLMLLIVFCMGLSMFDVFHLPVLDLQSHHSSSPKMQAFSTGMFTTLLATPCSGPLLGGVLAWGITKPLPVLMTIFAATGVGMATPYVLLACFPPAHTLSAPARLVAQRAGTRARLSAHGYGHLSVLPAASGPARENAHHPARGSHHGMDMGTLGKPARLHHTTDVPGSLCLRRHFPSGFWAFLPAQKEIVPWVEFSEEEFRANMGKKAMIVEFTADWCPTCKVLERTTLAAPNLLPILDQYSLTAVKVDMTFKNASHQELLKALNSASIPLLAIFPEGDGASRPVILRDIYTTTDLHLALRQAKIPHKRMVEMLDPVKLLSEPKE